MNKCIICGGELDSSDDKDKCYRCRLKGYYKKGNVIVENPACQLCKEYDLDEECCRELKTKVE